MVVRTVTHASPGPQGEVALQVAPTAVTAVWQVPDDATQTWPSAQPLTLQAAPGCGAA
jgi:hypothetical protein